MVIIPCAGLLSAGAWPQVLRLKQTGTSEAPAKTVTSGNWILKDNTWINYFSPVGSPKQ